MNWEQVKAWLLERVDEAPWYRRWPAKAALWALERELAPEAGLGCLVWFGIIWIIIIIVLIIAFR